MAYAILNGVDMTADRMSAEEMMILYRHYRYKHHADFQAELKRIDEDSRSELEKRSERVKAQQAHNDALQTLRSENNQAMDYFLNTNRPKDVNINLETTDLNHVSRGTKDALIQTQQELGDFHIRNGNAQDMWKEPDTSKSYAHAMSQMQATDDAFHKRQGELQSQIDAELRKQNRTLHNEGYHSSNYDLLAAKKDFEYADYKYKQADYIAGIERQNTEHELKSELRMKGQQLSDSEYQKALDAQLGKNQDYQSAMQSREQYQQQRGDAAEKFSEVNRANEFATHAENHNGYHFEERQALNSLEQLHAKAEQEKAQAQQQQANQPQPVNQQASQPEPNRPPQTLAEVKQQTSQIRQENAEKQKEATPNTTDLQAKVAERSASNENALDALMAKRAQMKGQTPNKGDDAAQPAQAESQPKQPHGGQEITPPAENKQEDVKANTPVQPNADAKQQSAMDGTIPPQAKSNREGAQTPDLPPPTKSLKERPDTGAENAPPQQQSLKTREDSAQQSAPPQTQSLASRENYQEPKPAPAPTQTSTQTPQQPHTPPTGSGSGTR